MFRDNNLTYIKNQDCTNINYNLLSYNKLIILRLILDYSPYCNWNKLKGWQWQNILCNYPELSIYCDWDKLSGSDWCWLLRCQPQFYIYCNWDKFNDSDWIWLLRTQPQFVEYRKS